jgi:hypothetical protein
MSALKIDLTDDTIKFIIEDFTSNPNRAKHCNISLFIHYPDRQTYRFFALFSQKMEFLLIFWQNFEFSTKNSHKIYEKKTKIGAKMPQKLKISLKI